MSERQRILSGTRATSDRLHLGNYEGAIRKWVELQDEFDVYCMVADWHCLTTALEDQPNVHHNSLEIAKDIVASGIDPARSVLFIQSDVKEHAELHLLLSMVIGVGKLSIVPTYKEKVSEITGDRIVSYGLLGYPVLQAADILLYKPYGVPVGKDQAPHLEVSRDIARSFNNFFAPVFPDFKNIIDDDESRSKLPGLDMRKMSKSYDNCIYLNETADETAARIKKAFTTPTKIKKTDPGIPEGCAVCQILKIYDPNYQQKWDEDIAGERGCMQSKTELIEIVNEYLRPIRERRAQLDDDTMRDILRDGAARARAFAGQTMEEVRKAMRLI